MKISGINFESIVDGDGVRVVIYFSGCLHNCKGCHNPSSHDFDSGQLFSEKIQDEIIDYILDTPFISGLTLSGGDPMYSTKDIIPYIIKIRNKIKDISIWVYSGFTYEEIINDVEMSKLLILCDVLVDGQFILEQRDMTLAYKGSTNQRIIDIQKSIEQNQVILLYE